MNSRVTACRALPLTTINATLVVMSVEMRRPALSSLRVKDGEQRADLLMVTVNHDPPLASLSGALTNMCQKDHGVYVMNHHGRGALLKAAGCTRVVTHEGCSSSVQSMPTLPCADLCDVNLMQAYRMGVSRTRDMSFRTSPTSPGDLLMVWVDESAQSRREEADYATIIEKQIELIRSERTDSGGWTVSFACVLDTALDVDGPLLSMMHRTGVRVYKSHQSLVDSLFGIEIDTHDAKSCMNVYLAHKDDATTHPAFHSGRAIDVYLSTASEQSEGISVTAASHPANTSRAHARGSLQGLHVSAGMDGASSKEATIVLVSDRARIDTVVFGPDRRMGDSEVLPISFVTPKIPSEIDRVIGDLLRIRQCDAKGDGFVEGFSYLARSTAAWDAAHDAVLLDMTLEDQTVVKYVVGDLIRRACKWLQSPVTHVLHYPSSTGLYDRPNPLRPDARGRPPPMPSRERQQSLALMMQ